MIPGKRQACWTDHLTVAELKRIWDPAASGTLTNWKQVRDGFPDRPMRLFGPDDESGTFDYFTQAVVGTQRASRADYTSNKDVAAVVRAVAGRSGRCRCSSRRSDSAAGREVPAPSPA